MAVLEFLIKEVFGVAYIFLAIIALVGLLLQKKSFSEVLTGVFKTALGMIILQQGVNILLQGILPIATAVAAVNPAASAPPSMEAGDFMAKFGLEIGVAMLLGFGINLLVARFTRWKVVFLTGHMLYWFPFVFVGVAANAGFVGIPLMIIASVFTAAYFIIAPNLARPYVREVTGDDSFTLGHPSIIFVLVGGFLAKRFGNKEKSTEDLNLPKGLGFLKEVAISGSIVTILVYIVLTIILAVMGVDYHAIYGVGDKSIFQFVLTSGLTFGAGLTILLLGVRMLIGEIVPAFTGIQEKLIPNAIPAYDCPLLFPFAPNAVILGFLMATLTSVITIIVTSSLGIFQYTVIPVVITCFFECGTAAVVGNARGGRRGALIASAVSGILLVFLMGFSLPFVDKTIGTWMLGNAGQDFSLWAIISGLILKPFGH